MYGELEKKMQHAKKHEKLAKNAGEDDPHNWGLFANSASEAEGDGIDVGGDSRLSSRGLSSREGSKRNEQKRHSLDNHDLHAPDSLESISASGSKPGSPSGSKPKVLPPADM